VVLVTIIKSLLDQDFYKFTMGQFVFHRYAGLPVKYALIVRSPVKLSRILDEEEVRNELDFAKEIRFNKTDLHYLRGTNEYGERMFQEDYLEFLEKFRLPDYELKWEDDIELSFSGKWEEAIYWETIALAIINQLYMHSFLRNISQLKKDEIEATRILRLGQKVRLLREYPHITFSDFGTRRRESVHGQNYIIVRLAEELPKQFLGTSNVMFAAKYGLLPMGTSAHELFQVIAFARGSSDYSIRESHNKVLQEWWEEYGWGLSIALTDTFGTEFFFQDITTRQARAWKGFRHDSGDPFKFGEKTIRFYKERDIDPKKKMIIFSDGLNTETIIALANHFKGRIQTTFGWGTNLTNDVGIDPISIVIKIVESNGYGTVKLSDNIAKATGKPEDVERFKRIFGYTSKHEERCKY
jgi:nicotinate phosphoribosyltransferase